MRIVNFKMDGLSVLIGIMLVVCVDRSFALNEHGATSVTLTCADASHMVILGGVKCSTSTGTLPTLSDPVKLANLKPICLGKNTCTVTVTSLGGTACSGATPHTLINYYCDTSIKALGTTAVPLVCSTGLVIKVTETRCSASGGASPSAIDVPRMTEVQKFCQGIPTCNLVVANIGPTACVNPTSYTLIRYQCVAAIQAFGTIAVPLVCSTGLMIKVTETRCSKSGGGSPSAIDVPRMTEVQKFCQGTQTCNLVVANIGPTACVNLTPFTLIRYQCVAALMADGLASLQLACGAGMMIEPTEVKCSAAGGANPTATIDAVRLAKVKTLSLGARSYTVTVADLGGTPCVGATPNTLIDYNCKPTLKAEGATSVQLMCGQDLMIVSTQVRCSAAGGATPTAADAAKLTALKTLSDGANVYTVTVADLGGTACPGATPNTLIDYRCLPELMADGATSVELKCGKDLMIVPTEVKCSAVGGANPSASADGTRLANLKTLCEGANAYTATVTELGGTACTGGTPNTLISYKCAAVFWKDGATSVDLKCGKDLMIAPAEVKCSAAGGANPTATPDAARLTKLKTLCEGANTYTVTVTDLGGTACTAPTPNTLIGYKCASVFMADGPSTIQLKCGMDLVIVSTEVRCSAPGGATPTAADAAKLATLNTLSQGTNPYTVTVTDLGGTACAPPTANTLINYKCAAVLMADGPTTVQLMCGKDLMIVPTEVKCSAAGGANPTATADVTRLAKLKTLCEGANTYTVTVTELGGTACTGGTPNTLISYKCAAVFWKDGATSVDLKCGKDLMIAPAEVKCSAAGGANPTATPDAARLTKLKTLCEGANTYTVTVTDLGGTACTAPTSNTLIGYKCASVFMADDPSTIQLKCGMDLMIVPTEVKCSATGGANPTATADAARLTKLKTLCQGANPYTVTVTDLGGTTCTAPTPNTLISYKCATVLMADGPTSVQLMCGKDLMIVPTEVKCSAAGGANPTANDAPKLTTLTTLCQGANTYTVTVTDLGGTACGAATPNTLVNYKCAPVLMADGPTTVQLMCGKDLMIVPTEVKCSAAGGANPSATADAARLTKLKTLCQGANTYLVTVTDLGGTACTAPTPNTLINYKCAPVLMADGATSVSLMCGKDLMIVPTEVKCSAAGGANPTANDAPKLTTLKTLCQGANTYTVTVTDLGGTACAAPTPNTLVNYKCTPVLMADGPTSIQLMCGKDLMIVPTEVKCSTAGGANPTATPDAARLTKLKTLCQGANTYTVIVTDLGGTACTAPTPPNTLISYKCTAVFMADGPTSVQLMCGKDLMIMPTAVQCSAPGGTNPSAADAARLTEVKNSCRGAGSCTVAVASLGGTACIAPTPNTRISYTCVTELKADGNPSLQLMCGQGLMVDPTAVKCSAAGGANPGTADTAKLTVLKTQMGQVNKHTVTVSTLGAPACAAPTPNTLVCYKCAAPPLGYQCYHCNSNDAPAACGTTFQASDPKVVTQFGCNACQKSTLGTVVTRSCSTTQCTPNTLVEDSYTNEVQCCFSNQCNSSSRGRYDLLVMLLAVIAATCLHTYASADA